MTIYNRYVKRMLDIIFALIMTVLFSPLAIIVAVMIRVKLGNPVLFKQERPGLHEKIFVLYKFRTMTDARDEKGLLLPYRERLTKFGTFLRSTSLDELPELFNILKGDMSFVGPRPLLVQYLPLYNEEQKKRHSVRPGLTGLAQVNGRNAISWEERFRLDIQYVENISPGLDLKILITTVSKVLKREGIHSQGTTTMKPFTGSKR